MKNTYSSERRTSSLTPLNTCNVDRDLEMAVVQISGIRNKLQLFVQIRIEKVFPNLTKGLFWTKVFPNLNKGLFRTGFECNYIKKNCAARAFFFLSLPIGLTAQSSATQGCWNVFEYGEDWPFWNGTSSSFQPSYLVI